MIKKTAKTEQMLEILRQNFTDEDYKEYILGNLKMKDVLVDKKNSRQTLFISASGQNVFDVFHNFLGQKRKVGK